MKRVTVFGLERYIKERDTFRFEFRTPDQPWYDELFPLQQFFVFHKLQTCFKPTLVQLVSDEALIMMCNISTIDIEELEDIKELKCETVPGPYGAYNIRISCFTDKPEHGDYVIRAVCNKRRNTAKGKGD